MVRPKEFDRDAAVERAMSVFWSKGYASTSTDDLLQAMQIGRQSMYDTFGDNGASMSKRSRGISRRALPGTLSGCDQSRHPSPESKLWSSA